MSPRWTTLVAWFAAGLGPILASPPLARGGDAIPVEGFEGKAEGWKFVGGEEFPGAKGGFDPSSTPAHGGARSAKISADFRGGGVYVGAWKDLEPLKLPDVAAIRAWVRVENLKSIGVRLVDDSGQCHQGKVDVPDGADEGWRLLTIRVSDVAGGEHWGGLNDGAWHGPPKGLGLNLGKDALADPSKGTAALWIDDVSADPTPAGMPTLVSCSVEPKAVRPGFGPRMNYAWDAEPLGAKVSVFVHFVDAEGRMIFQADHDPKGSTIGWRGRVEYGRSVTVPMDAKPGRYDVVVGLWDGRPSAVGGGRRPFRIAPGSGLEMRPDFACKVGSIEVSPDAPLPALSGPKLDLSGYRLTFDESFSKPLDVSSWGPGTRWIAHTPYAGDFGDAGFADPGGPDSPFSVESGILRIRASKKDGRWRSGLLSSVDPKGDGFSQRFGYFEMKAKFPRGAGTWPAFWLMGVPQLKEPKDKKTITQVEIDVVEQYGVGPNTLHTTVHLWGPGPFHEAEGDATLVAGMDDGFHTYGVSVEDDFTDFYFDGVRIRRDPTLKEAKVPLYILVDLALGGGWPVDKTPNPSDMMVDHVRVYSRR